MGKSAFQHTQVKLRDNQRIVLYFKNQTWATGFKLSNKIIKDSTSKEQSKTAKTLLKEWKLGDSEKANKTIYEMKNEIDGLIDEARGGDFEIIPFVKNKLASKNQELLTLLITKQTKPHEALEKFIERKLQLKFLAVFHLKVCA